jgi:minichromosome maintenance protein 10
MPHDQFVDFLRGRYYISPSQLYSVIRLLPDKQGYEVPVEGEWVTIAVVAERGPINHTRAPVGLEREEDDLVGRNGKPLPGKPTAGKAKTPGSAPPKLLGKKYVSLKLIDFGCQSDSGANGGKPIIRGDASLSLLLFESDTFDTVDSKSGGLPKKVYKGGSKGAFEHMSKLREGAVIALLTPKILKPFQVGGFLLDVPS